MEIENEKMSAGAMRKKIRAMMAESEEMRATMDGKDLDEMSEEEMRAMIEKMMMSEAAKSFAGNNALKAISRTDDQLIVGNYIVLFGGRDLTGIGNRDAKTRLLGNPVLMKKNLDGSVGEFFTAQTNFESPYTFKGVLDVDWEHGFEDLPRDEVIGFVDWNTKSIDEKGVFVRRVLNRRSKYVQWLEPLIDAGLIGNSTEAVDALSAKKANGEITRWGLRRDTLTVTPVEPRMMTENVVAAMKALKIFQNDVESEKPGAQAEGGQATVAGAVKTETTLTITQVPKLGEIKMSDELKAIVDKQAETLTAQAATIAEQDKQIKSLQGEVGKVVDALKKEPPTASGVRINPDDKYPYKSFKKNSRGQIEDATGYGEFLQDVFRAATEHSVAPKLASVHDLAMKAIKATGLNAAIPSQGGFFTQTDHNAELIRNVMDTGAILSGVRKFPLGANSDSLTLNGVNETSRASTIWGGILAYWKAEAASLTATKPAFREIRLEVKPLTALYYATDKLLKTAPALGAIVADGFREAMTFKVEDAIINGDGAGKPFGLLSNGALVSVSKETGQAAATLLHENISKMKARMFPASFSRAVWLANIDTQPQWDLMAFTIGTAGVLSPFITYGTDGVMRAYGRPVVFVEHCKTLGTVGDVILWDPASYLYTDLGAVEEASSIHVQFAAAETAFRFMYYCDGQPQLASALTPAQGTNTLSTHIALATRA